MPPVSGEGTSYLCSAGTRSATWFPAAKCRGGQPKLLHAKDLANAKQVQVAAFCKALTIGLLADQGLCAIEHHEPFL